MKNFIVPFIFLIVSISCSTNNGDYAQNENNEDIAEVVQNPNYLFQRLDSILKANADKGTLPDTVPADAACLNYILRLADTTWLNLSHYALVGSLVPFNPTTFVSTYGSFPDQKSLTEAVGYFKKIYDLSEQFGNIDSLFAASDSLSKFYTPPAEIYAHAIWLAGQISEAVNEVNTSYSTLNEALKEVAPQSGTWPQSTKNEVNLLINTELIGQQLMSATSTDPTTYSGWISGLNGGTLNTTLYNNLVDSIKVLNQEGSDMNVPSTGLYITQGGDGVSTNMWFMLDTINFQKAVKANAIDANIFNYYYYVENDTTTNSLVFMSGSGVNTLANFLAQETNKFQSEFATYSSNFADVLTKLQTYMKNSKSVYNIAAEDLKNDSNMLISLNETLNDDKSTYHKYVIAASCSPADLLIPFAGPFLAVAQAATFGTLAGIEEDSISAVESRINEFSVDEQKRAALVTQIQALNSAGDQVAPNGTTFKNILGTMANGWSGLSTDIGMAAKKSTEQSVDNYVALIEILNLGQAIDQWDTLQVAADNFKQSGFLTSQPNTVGGNWAPPGSTKPNPCK